MGHQGPEFHLPLESWVGLHVLLSELSAESADLDHRKARLGT